MKKLLFIFLFSLVFASCITINKYYPTEIKQEVCTREHQGGVPIGSGGWALPNCIPLPTRIIENKGYENCPACKHSGCLVNGCNYSPEHSCELFKKFRNPIFQTAPATGTLNIQTFTTTNIFKGCIPCQTAIPL